MPGRTTYTQAELDHAQPAIVERVAACDKLVRSVQGAADDPRDALSLKAFEPVSSNDLVPELDRYFVMRSTTDGLWICDESGRTIVANDRLAEILGRSAEEMSGLAVADVLDLSGLETLFGLLDELTRGKSGRVNVQCNLDRKDGSRISALVSYSPMLDDEGVRRGWLYRRVPPLAPAAVRPSSASAPASASVQVSPIPDASRGAVLVADDNVVNQMVARGVLEGLGYTVEFAQDGLEAVAAVAATPGHFVAVLMDCQMPQLDGYEATRVIRQLEQPDLLRVPVIAMTASTLRGERERCLAAGMDDFLLKPVDFELLETTLARWVRGESPAQDDRPCADASGLLDLTRIRMLRDLRPGDQSFLDQFVDTFVAGVPDDVAAIASAVLVADHGRVVEAAHRLKGSALNLGAVEVGRVCQALEDAGGQQDAFAASDLLPVLEDLVERTLMALRALT